MRRLLGVTMLWVLILPYVLIGTGAASNQLVLIANHDKFPVMLNEAARAGFKPDENGLIDKEHCVMTEATHLNVLADIFDFHSGWFSVGDGLVILGEWLNSFTLYVWIALAVKSLYQRRRYDS